MSFIDQVEQEIADRQAKGTATPYMQICMHCGHSQDESIEKCHHCGEVMP